MDYFTERVTVSGFARWWAWTSLIPAVFVFLISADHINGINTPTGEPFRDFYDGHVLTPEENFEEFRRARFVATATTLVGLAPLVWTAVMPLKKKG